MVRRSITAAAVALLLFAGCESTDGLRGGRAAGASDAGTEGSDAAATANDGGASSEAGGSRTDTLDAGGDPVTVTLTVALAGGGMGSVSSGDTNDIACGDKCSHAYPLGTVVALNATPQAGSSFIGWKGPCPGSIACKVTLDADTTVTATFESRVLDIDENNAYAAGTDGLLISRYMFGLTGTSLTDAALGANALRTSPVDIKNYLDGMGAQLDVDGNGTKDALTDALLIQRYMNGLRGTSLTNGAVGNGATRTTATQIEPYLAALMP